MALRKKSQKQRERQLKHDPAIYLAIIIVAISFVMSAYFYPLLPDVIASHWGLYGEANGFSGKDFTLLLFPLLSLALVVLLYVVPRFDPLEKNIRHFAKHYHAFIAVMAAFFLYMQMVVIALNLGVNLNIGFLLAPAFAMLFYAIGVMVGKAQQNYFIGIRTPWTLANKDVWNKTHHVGAQLFKWCGLICLLGVFWPELAFGFILAPVLISVVVMFVYSYLEFKKEKRR